MFYCFFLLISIRSILRCNRTQLSHSPNRISNDNFFCATHKSLNARTQTPVIIIDVFSNKRRNTRVSSVIVEPEFPHF